LASIPNTARAACSGSRCLRDNRHVVIGDMEEKNRRRKRILLRYNLAVLLGYAIPLLTMYVARWQDLISTEYAAIHVVTVYVGIVSLVFILLGVLKKDITDRFANIVYVGQFIAWLCIYFYAIIIINEIRTIALLWGSIGLVFLLSPVSGWP